MSYSSGHIESYRERLVEMRFSREAGIDFGEIFAAESKHQAMRLFLTLVGQHLMKYTIRVRKEGFHQCRPLK